MANQEAGSGGSRELKPADFRQIAKEWVYDMHRLRMEGERERNEKVAASLRCVGRPRVNYGRPEIDEMVKLILAGHGRISACAALGIGYRSFHRHLKANPAVAAEIRLAERLRLDRCAEIVYQKAVGPGEPVVRLRAAMFYLNRQDRLDAARAARREKADRGGEPAGAGRTRGGPDGPIEGGRRP